MPPPGAKGVNNTTMEFLDQSYLGNTLRQWLIAGGIFVALTLLLFFVRGVVVGRLKALAEKTTTVWDDMVFEQLKKTRKLFLVGVAIYVASFAVVLTPTVQLVIQKGFIILLLIQLAIWGNALIGQAIVRATRHKMEKDAAQATTMSALGFLSKLVLWTVVLLLGLDNLGFNITALVTTVGIGGIAVALALQNILGDLFASLSIVLDKPFVIGDFVIVGDFLGTVENVGLKTTRIRSLSGEQIVFSNSDLLNSRIRNYKRMQERRILFTVGVTYQTPRAKLEKIPGIVREIIGKQELTRFDRAHFKEFGDFSLMFEVVYFMKSPDYNVYMDTQEKINLELHRHFEAEGIEFAYPTSTVFLERSAQGSQSRSS
jgi:small-conductance mechanosensitive channel